MKKTTMPGKKQNASSSASSIPVPKKLSKILSKRKQREASNGHDDDEHHHNGHHHVHTSACSHSHGLPTSAKRQRLLNRRESADVENEDQVNESDAINSGVTNEEITEEARDEHKKYSRQVFEYLISPFTLQDFYDEYWEKKQLLIKRAAAAGAGKKQQKKKATSSAPTSTSSSSYNHNHYSFFQVAEGVKVMNGNGDHTIKLDVTKASIEQWIDRSEMEYGNDIEISKHARGKKVLMTPEVRKTTLAEIQEFVQTGCTVKLMNPQLYSDSVLNLLSSLELFLKVPVKAHFLLTPPKSHGVAPHMVSGDVFILQLEGSKTWRIFKSHEEKHNSLHLNNQQSIFLTQEDMQTLEPVTEETLDAGDLLYIPKGYVQQAYTDEEQDTHSLHLAITCNSPKNRWADFMALALTKALENAVEEDPEFSRIIPRTTYDFLGLYPASSQSNDRTDGEDIAEDTSDPRREKFMDQFEKLMAKLIDFIPYDYATDQLAQEFYAKRLPPLITEKDRWHQFGGLKAAKKLTLDTQVRLVRKDAVRLAAEDHEVILSTYINNPRANTGTQSLESAIESTSIILPIDCGIAASLLIDTYPDYISVRELKISEDGDEKESIEFAQTLFEKGVLVTVPAPKRTLPE